MRSLRFRYAWLFGGLCLVGLVLYLTLSPLRPNAIMLYNDKMSHGIAFMALMAWFSGIFEMRFAVWIALALLCLGISIEFIQAQLTYRSAELADGLADVVGIGAGWVLAIAGLQHWAAWLESWLVPDRS